MDRLTWTVLVEQAPRTIIRHRVGDLQLGQPPHVCHLSCISGRIPRLSKQLADSIIDTAEVYHALPAAGERCRWCRRPFNSRPHHAFLPQPKVGHLSRQVGAGAFVGKNTGNWVEKRLGDILSQKLSNMWLAQSLKGSMSGAGPPVQNLPRVVGKPPELGMDFKTSNWRK